MAIYRKLKFISIFIAVTFCVNIFLHDIGYGQQPIDSQPGNPDILPYQKEEIIIPARFGYIDDIYIGKSDTFVFQIKDAHCNYDAQKAIYALLDWLVAKYGVRLVNLEGGSGEYDLSLLEDIEANGIKDGITEEYLQEGRLSGAELYRVYNPSKIDLAGIEDGPLYEENLQAYRSILAYRNEIDAFLSGARSVLEKKKGEVFRKDLKAFIENKELFADNRMGLGAYLGYLYRTAVAMNADVADMPNIIAMSGMLVKEKGIDFDKAALEREKVVTALLERLSRFEREEFLSKIQDFENGTLRERDFYLYVLGKSGEIGSDTQNYPDLSRYAEYLAIYAEMDEKELFKEISRLEERVSGSLCRGEEEKKLLKYLMDVAMLERMFGLRLSRDEFDRVRRSADIVGLLSFLKLSGLAEKDYERLAAGAAYAAHGFSAMLEFYALAEERDDAFIRNITANMRTYGAETCAVVTGGFHSGNLCRLMRERGISYVSISPAFVNPKDYKSPYMEILCGRRIPVGRDVMDMLASTIQIKSLWSGLGVDTEFALVFMNRISTALAVEKLKGTEGIIVQLGEKKVFFAKDAGYVMSDLVPAGYENRRGFVVIDAARIMKTSPAEFTRKLSGLLGPGVDLGLANRFSANTNMSAMLKALLTVGRASPREETAKVPKIALLRTYEGKIVEQPVKGLEKIDSFTYIFNVTSGLLTCQSSSARVKSGYMENPGPVKGNNEKSYLCEKIRYVFRPGLSNDERKKRMRELLDEQRRYEEEGRCGWEWVVDRDDKGDIYVDEVLGYGLRRLVIYDRTKLPDGIEPQNIEADAERYGGRRFVQEMQFEIIYFGGNDIRIDLTNTWAAEAEANTDALTGLYNRRYLQKVGKNVASRLPVAVLFIDVDEFKHFNDDYSHDVGDDVLISVAHAILRCIRGADIAFRWGGDEFLVLLPETALSSAQVVAKNISKKVRETRVSTLPESDGVSVTIGVVGSESLSPGKGLMDFIEGADQALLDAKHTNKGSVFVYDETRPEKSDRAFESENGFKEIPVDRITRDLQDILDKLFPELIESLKKFLQTEKINGMSQGEGLERIFSEFSSRTNVERFHRMALFREKLAEQTANPQDRNDTAVTARRELRLAYLFFGRIKERMDYITDGNPSTSNVGRAMTAVEKIMDITFKYLTEKDKLGRRPSPFAMEDGDSLAWIDAAGNLILHPRLHTGSNELKRWHMRHEKWHRRLDLDYPDSSKGAKEIAAVYLAFNEFEEVNDEHLASLLYAIFPDLYLLYPEARSEEFVPGAVKYFSETSLEFFLASDKSEIEKAALRMIEDVEFGKAREKSFETSPGSSERAQGVITMAHIVTRRADLVDSGLISVLESELEKASAPERVLIEICGAVAGFADKRREHVKDSTILALKAAALKEGYSPKFYSSVSVAMAAVAKASPKVLAAHFLDIPPVFQIDIIAEMLKIDSAIPGDLKEGDRKSIRALCAYHTRQYLLGRTMPAWIGSLLPGSLALPALPAKADGSASMSVEEFFTDGALRDVIRETLSAAYVEPLAGRFKLYDFISIPGLRGEIKVVEPRQPDEVVGEKCASDGYNTALAPLLGFSAPTDETVRGARCYYELPACSDYSGETILIHVLRECGLIQPYGVHIFCQSVASRMPDEAKYIQIVNLMLSPARHRWQTWSTNDPYSGMPPLAYGRGDHKDETVFSDGVIFTAPVVRADTASMSYDGLMEHFVYTERSRQLMSWAFKASLVPEGERSAVQKDLAAVWSEYVKGIRHILDGIKVKSHLADTAWISSEPMDGVAVNDSGYSFGSSARRATIKEGLEMLEEAKQKDAKVMAAAFGLVTECVKLVQEAIDREYLGIEKTVLQTNTWQPVAEMTIIEHKEEGPAVADLSKESSPLTAFLERVEELLRDEIGDGFERPRLSRGVFARIAGTAMGMFAPSGKRTSAESLPVPQADREEISDWLAKTTLFLSRSAGETRVIMYPVYDELTFTKEINTTSALRRRLLRDDYGFRVFPMPYLAGDNESRSRVFSEVCKALTTNPKCRAMVYSNEMFFQENSEKMKKQFGGRAVFVKEEGSASVNEFSYVDFSLRSALALAVIDYFDERNNFKDEHRERLKDMIAAMLAMITGDEAVMEEFRGDPRKLIEGIIILRPAERISWNEVEEKFSASKQFLKSL